MADGIRPDDAPASALSGAPPGVTPTDGQPSDARSFAQHHATRVELGVPSLTWGRGQARRVRLISDQIPLTGRRILDVGCGVGQYVQHLRALPADVFGIDVERTRVQQGSRDIVGLIVGTGERLPFRDASIDVVLLNEVIEHVPDEHATLAEAARVLPPGGHIVIYAPNRWFPFETHGVQWRGRYRFGNIPFVNYLPRRVRDRLVPHARAYSGRDIERLLRGLPTCLVHQSIVFPGFDGIRRRHARIGRLLQASVQRAERSPLHRIGLSHFLILEKIAPKESAS